MWLGMREREREKKGRSQDHPVGDVLMMTPFAVQSLHLGVKCGTEAALDSIVEAAERSMDELSEAVTPQNSDVRDGPRSDFFDSGDAMHFWPFRSLAPASQPRASQNRKRKSIHLSR